MPTNPKSENTQFKILYAFGMIFMVAGHCGNGGMSLFYDWFAPYSFHMPLFIFISGYFFKAKNSESLGNLLLYIKKKFCHLLLPMYAWNFAYGILSLVLHRLGFGFGYGLTVKNLLIFPLNNGHQYTLNLATWFVAPLFFCEIANVVSRFVFEKMLAANKNKNVIINIAIPVIFLLLGNLDFYVCLKKPEAISLFTKRFLFFLAFYQAGNLYKDFFEKRDTLGNAPYFALIFFFQLVLVTFRSGQVAYTPSWMTGFSMQSDVILPYICAFLGIGFWLRVSRILVPVLESCKAMRIVSDNGFSIMTHHFLGFMFLKGMFAIASKKTQFFGNFDMEQFKKNIWYYYLPHGQFQWFAVYVFVAFCISILIGLVEKKAKSCIKDLWNSRKRMLCCPHCGQPIFFAHSITNL